jgi:hypothetical protein
MSARSDNLFLHSSSSHSYCYRANMDEIFFARALFWILYPLHFELRTTVGDARSKPTINNQDVKRQQQQQQRESYVTLVLSSV